MKTKSIIQVPDGINVDKVSRNIEELTRGKVEGYTVSEGMVTFHIVHHDKPRCPHCGMMLHDYAHGLCLLCWMEFRGSILE